MKYLFIHNNYPGQFLHIINDLIIKGHDVVFISNYFRQDTPKDKIHLITIPAINTKAFESRSESHKIMQEMFFTGESFGSAMMTLRKSGYTPDVIYAHPGWAGATYVRDIFPDSYFIIYCEWFYTKGELYNFFSKDQKQPQAFSKNRIKNIFQLNALHDCDVAISPTSWQHAQYPIEVSKKIQKIHDGIDMDYFSPDAEKDVTVQGINLHQFDEIVTYATRGMEPFRGFPQFFKSIPIVLQKRPNAHIVIMGNDTCHYGPMRSDGKTWLSALKTEIKIDWSRVHILKFGSYEEYRKVLRSSTVHIYMTAPFVLSWSLLEAMSCKCLVIASATSPVHEVIKHGHNGLLTPFWDIEALANSIVYALSNSNQFNEIRDNARKTIYDKYNLKTNLPAILNIINNSKNMRTITSKYNINNFKPTTY